MLLSLTGLAYRQLLTNCLVDRWAHINQAILTQVIHSQWPWITRTDLHPGYLPPGGSEFGITNVSSRGKVNITVIPPKLGQANLHSSSVVTSSTPVNYDDRPHHQNGSRSYISSYRASSHSGSSPAPVPSGSWACEWCSVHALPGCCIFWLKTLLCSLGM